MYLCHDKMNTYDKKVTHNTICCGFIVCHSGI